MKTKLRAWEVLVPRNKNNGKTYSYAHHQIWDEFVCQYSNGITICRVAKGRWRDEDGKLYEDSMIPVKLICSKSDLHKILEFTKQHYNQKAVIAFKLHDYIII